VRRMPVMVVGAMPVVRVGVVPVVRVGSVPVGRVAVGAVAVMTVGPMAMMAVRAVAVFSLDGFVKIRFLSGFFAGTLAHHELNVLIKEILVFLHGRRIRIHGHGHSRHCK